MASVRDDRGKMLDGKVAVGETRLRCNTEGVRHLLKTE